MVGVPFDSDGLKQFLVFVDKLLCEGEHIVDKLIVHETLMHLAFPWLSVVEIISAENNNNDVNDNGECEADDHLKAEFADALQRS